MKTADIQELEQEEVEAHMQRLRGPRRRSPEVPSDPDGPGSPSLTTAQRRFARRHRAAAGTDSAVLEAVFFYRSGDHGTDRWLVDGEGRVLDHSILK